VALQALTEQQRQTAVMANSPSPKFEQEQFGRFRIDHRPEPLQNLGTEQASHGDTKS
jgi:hypothetical protein